MGCYTFTPHFYFPTMKQLFFGLLVLSMSCTRPTLDTLKPNTKPDVEPTLTEMKTGTDSLYIDSQFISTRTSTTDISVFCQYGSSISLFTRHIREVGYCLSATDSTLSVLNPQHNRTKAVFDTNRNTFKVTIPNLIANQRYFIDPYFITKDGRVYYGRSLKSSTLQTPSWFPRSPANSITSFSITHPNPSDYKIITITNRSSPPINGYFFTANSVLFLLGSEGLLWRYNIDQDKWEKRKQLTIGSSGRFNGWPAVVFGINKKGYVLYTEAIFPNPTTYWEYNPDTDEWSTLPVPEKIIVAGLASAYQIGNELVLRDSYAKTGFRFNPIQKRLDPIKASSLLLTEPYNSLRFVQNAPEPIGYTTESTLSGTITETDIATEIRSLNIVRYSAEADRFDSKKTVSSLRIDSSPTVAFAVKNDLFFGLGNTNTFLRNSRIISEVTNYSDDLIQYSVETGQIKARYNLAIIRQGSETSQTNAYQIFTLAEHTLLVDRLTNKVWELVF